MSSEEDEWGGSQASEDDRLPRDPPEVVAARQLRCINILLFLFGAGLTGFAYWVAIKGLGGGFMAYIVACLGLLVALMSCVGCCGASVKHQRILLLYYSCLLFATMAALVAGGFCFILNEQAQSIVADNWEEIAVEDGTDEDSSDAENELQRNLYITGAAAFFVMFLLICAMSSVTGIVDKQQAYALLMQASNMTMLPFGFVLVAGAVFIADTAASADAPSTAMGIFAMGVFVIGLTLLGCISVSILARGLIRLFVILVFLVGLLFFAFGVVAFVQAETLKQSITDNWTTIRRVLPPTFAGKYDQEQFTNFLEANLNAAGFISLCMGVLLMTQVWAGTKLRGAIKLAAREEEEQFGRGGENVTARAFARDSGKCCDLKRCWKRNWTKGSKKTRCWVICGCSCLCFFLLIVVGVATMALYFSTSCASLSEFSQTVEYPSPPGVNITLAQVFNNYTRGSNDVVVDAHAVSLYTTFEKSALRKSFASDASALVTFSASGELTTSAEPKADTKILGFDVSCQQSIMTTVLPALDLSAFGLSQASTSDLTLDLQGVGLVANEASLPDTAPRFKYVRFESEHGANTLENVKIGDQGLAIVSDTGEVLMSQLDAQCNKAYIGGDEFGLRITTRLGGIILQDSTVRNCDIVASAQASLVRIDRVTTSTDRTVGALISVSGDKGLIEVLSSSADEFLLTGNDGSVKVSDSTVRDSIKASSVGGSVLLSNVTMAVRATMQVETTSGLVSVTLRQFAGFVSLHTSGTITVKDHDEPHWSNYEATENQNPNAVTANVNCASKGDCAYLGEVLIISKTGAISLTVEPWVRE